MIQFLRDLVTKDFWLKLFSLALAVLIWFTISFALQKQVSPVTTLGVDIRERTFYNLPVVAMSSAEDVRHFKVSPSEVEVTVQGDARILQTLQSSQIRAMVDLTGTGPGREPRKRIEVCTPPGVTHVRVNPPEAQASAPPKS